MQMRFVLMMRTSSRPSRARGLKHCFARIGIITPRVAPLAGAWIETIRSVFWLALPKSRPSRARGLKQRRAGLLDALFPVAPLAGAWIETFVKLYPKD